MTKEALAALLNGRQYGKEITKEEQAQAAAAGLVVVFGYSDDNCEFRGAIYDEYGAYEGAELYFYNGKVIEESQLEEDEEVLERYGIEIRKGKKIECLWCEEEGYSWTYRTDIPHATFEILEGDEPYCRGIVFALADAG